MAPITILGNDMPSNIDNSIFHAVNFSKSNEFPHNSSLSHSVSVSHSVHLILPTCIMYMQTITKEKSTTEKNITVKYKMHTETNENLCFYTIWHARETVDRERMKHKKGR